MRKKINTDRDESKAAFTLLEVLVSIAIFGVILIILFDITNLIAKASAFGGKIDSFHDAREAFETINRSLSQATLNTYYDYDGTSGSTSYVRQSELRFISGNASSLIGTNHPTHAIFFQAPLGSVSNLSNVSLNSLLNTTGYYIEYGDDSNLRPQFLTSAIYPLLTRFRLMQVSEYSENLAIYNYTSGKTGSTPNNLTYIGHQWFTNSIDNQQTQVLANNIIALVVLPKLSSADDSSGTKLAPNYSYDSTTTNADPTINPKNQLPPIVQVTMVAVDEASFKRSQPTISDLGLNGMFQVAGDLTDPSQPGFAKDIQNLELTLQSRRLTYRVFTSSVVLKGAKWSRSQSN